jgi:ribulose-5-phosphate 4-epimerase/fuculose-1-phosphate aldolase
MPAETELREKLATCTRIMAMQGLLGLYGHVSAYHPATKRFFICPGAGSDKAATRPDDLFLLELEGKVLEGSGRLALEWPIHAAIHAIRADALAVAHLHAPYSTLFAIAQPEFKPVTLNGMSLGERLPLYTKPKMVTTLEEGHALADSLGRHVAVLMRGHGSTVVGRSVEEVLFVSLLLEDNARNFLWAATLGEVGHFTSDEMAAFARPLTADSAKFTWDYFSRQEARWDHKSGVGSNPLV